MERTPGRRLGVVRKLAAFAVLVLAAALPGCGSDDPGPADAYRAYIEAINERDGAAVCQALDPRSIDKLRPRARGESCAEAVSASIGRPGPTGSRWKSARIDKGPKVVRRKGDSVTLSVAVEEEFGDRAEIWQGNVGMRQSGGRWLLTTPDQTLYHAIGQK